MSEAVIGEANDSAIEPRRANRWPLRIAIALRFMLGVALVATLVPTCVDEYFRVYHALHFWLNPSLLPSTNWLPLYVWVYGPVVGALGETVFAPRVASLVIGMIGALAASRDASNDDERRARSLLACCVPTGVLLYSSPLTEALFGALVTAYVTALARYRDDGRAHDALSASLALLAACAARYEAWVLIPALAVGLGTRAPTDARRALIFALALLPAVAPLRWMLHLAERVGDPWAFLGTIQRDQFGPGSISDALGGASTPLAIAFVLSLAALVYGAAPGRPQRIRLASAHGLLFAALFAALAAKGSLPSQLPSRLLHLPMLLAVPVVGFELVRRRATRSVLALSTLCFLLGLVSTLARPPGVPRDDAALAGRLRAELAADRSAVAVVQGPFPHVTSFVTSSSAVGRVQVDGAGWRCPASIATCTFRCGTPPWLSAVRLVVADSEPLGRTLAANGFREIARSQRYRLWKSTNAQTLLCRAAR